MTRSVTFKGWLATSLIQSGTPLCRVVEFFSFISSEATKQLFLRSLPFPSAEPGFSSLLFWFLSLPLSSLLNSMGFGLLLFP